MTLTKPLLDAALRFSVKRLWQREVTIDELRRDPEFLEASKDAVLMAIPFDNEASLIAAE